jgi:hypothetical protein
MSTSLLGVDTEYQTLSIEHNHSILEVGYVLPRVAGNSNAPSIDSLELSLMDRFTRDSLIIYLDQTEIKQLIEHLQSQLK